MDYKAILNDLINRASLEGAVLVSADGLPIASVVRSGIEEDRVSAISAAILSLGERAVKELDKGMLEQITIKAEGGYVIFSGIGQDAVLTVLASNDVKLGLLLMEIKRAQKELEKALAL